MSDIPQVNETFVEIANWLFIATVCSVIAGRLARYLRMYWQPRRPGETLGRFIARANEEFFSEKEREREREATKYGSRKKTLLVVFLGGGLGLGLAYLWARVPASFEPSLGYLALGLIVNSRLGVVQLDALTSLKWRDRLWLRLFYAWFWPLYLWVWLDARQQQR